MVPLKFLAPLFAVAVLASACGSSTVVRQVVERGPVLTIYVVNHAANYVSNREIRRSIPAWTQAANHDFAPVWHTPQVRIRLTSRPPKNSVVAVFKSKGPIKGALAFHNVERGIPHITVYAGTGAYYGYSNSVSFTHELFELLADPTISQTNQGWPYPFVYLGNQSVLQMDGTIWSNEVSDPVEKFAYRLPGTDGKPVLISDFITPNWFNDHVRGPFDFMGVTQQPFTIATGGYACFFVFKWSCLENFRHAGTDPAGYEKAEKSEQTRGK